MVRNEVEVANKYGEDTPIVVFCHGIRSDPSALLPAANFLAERVGDRAMIENFKYPKSWKDSVFLNACAVADFLANVHPQRPVIFVGHSMGGLVARVANIALTDTERFFEVVTRGGLGLSDRIVQSVTQLPVKEALSGSVPLRTGAYAAWRDHGTVLGVITLATPNSGAMANFEIANLLNLLGLKPLAMAEKSVQLGKTLLQGAHKAVQEIEKKVTGTNFSAEVIEELVSARLFRFFQFFRTETPIVSISGSRCNRVMPAPLKTVVADLFGFHNDFPHDIVVEDRSVDLKNAIMPSEVMQPCHNGKYRHHRVYHDCFEVDHSGITESKPVLDLIHGHIVRWIGGISDCAFNEDDAKALVY